MIHPTTHDVSTIHELGAPMRSERSGPLTDVRIIDLTQYLAGPFATMMLADMGADVIKVEPPGGEMLRAGGPFTPGDTDREFGGNFATSNRNKRSVELDLKDEDDVATFLRLVATADVVVENFRAGVMENLGLPYERLREVNPSLVYSAVRGFGDPRTGEGPYTPWPAFDVVAQAMGGVISQTGTREGEHVLCGPNIGDVYPATVAASGILAALHHARTTGQGQFVDVAMFDSLIAMSEQMSWQYAYKGEIKPPAGDQHATICPFELYECSDGQVAIAAPDARQWKELCAILDRPDMVDDEDYLSPRRRMKNRAAVNAVILAFTRPRTRAEVVSILGGRVPCGPVNDAADLVVDEHVRAREMFVAVDHPGAERPVLVPNTPIRFTETPTGVYQRAPRVGEHTDEVLAELEALEARTGEEPP